MSEMDEAEGNTADLTPEKRARERQIESVEQEPLECQCLLNG